MLGDRESESLSQVADPQGSACVEHNKAEGIKQRARRCHKGHAIAHALHKLSSFRRSCINSHCRLSKQQQNPIPGSTAMHSRAQLFSYGHAEAVRAG
eukprot:365025-Chlamydomonas_euryale.AAC.13